LRGVSPTGFLFALEAWAFRQRCRRMQRGAVVGGIAASGADLHAWSDTLAHLDPARFWRPDPWPRLAWRLAVRRGRGFVGLSGTEAAVEFCRSQLAVTRFEACRYPFYTLALSLGSGRKVMFSSGELAPRMVAARRTASLSAGRDGRRLVLRQRARGSRAHGCDLLQAPTHHSSSKTPEGRQS
jgi:hypothetical protein